MTVDLSNYSANHFDRGASNLKEALWIMVRCVFFAPSFPWPSRLRVAWLRVFGARIGKGVVIRSGVNIHFPWRLEIADHVWIGEGCWILNLALVKVESHCCLSQRSFLCTGNHDYGSPTFDLITLPIHLEMGAWIGAASIVCPGVTVSSHAMLAAGSVATRSLEPFGIYQGNPAVRVKERIIARPTFSNNAVIDGCGHEDG